MNKWQPIGTHNPQGPGYPIQPPQMPEASEQYASLTHTHRNDPGIDRIIELLEHQNTLIESFAHAFFAAKQQDEEFIAKLLGEGGPDPVEESMNAAERMRTGILRFQEEEDDSQELQDHEGQGTQG